MPLPPNQNREQKARDAIDAQLRAAGWAVQNKNSINFNAKEGQAILARIREERATRSTPKKNAKRFLIGRKLRKEQI